jgi:Uncharacterized protein conserved in bacteria (DUF2188)
MSNYHVMRRPDGSWEDKREHAERAAGLYETQAEAIAGAEQHAHNSGGGEVKIHRADNNKIRESYTIPPAKDPYPPKG